MAVDTHGTGGPAAPDRRRQSARLHEQVDAVHRYWLREYGHHPDSSDSMVIVGVLAALDELAAEGTIRLD